ncbi:Heat-inducible transcription repressor HrcA [subsurface metagenome]
MTKRQEKIIETIIKEHVRTSKPVSSKILVQKHKLGLSSATIRNEMKELEKAGYLSKPHTSAGRVPTEKAYRLFIKLLERKEMKIPIKKISRQSSEDVFEKHFNYLFKQAGKQETKVFINKEIPMVRTRKFTLIITNYKVSEKKQETIGLISPTRMRYDYNISLINKLREMLEDYE